MDRHRILSISSSVLAPLAALLLRFALNPVLSSRGGFIFFIIPVSVATWIGGLGGGIAALLISTGLCLRFLVDPAASHYGTDLSYLGLFVLSCLPMIGFSEMMLRSRRRLEEQTEWLKEADREKDRMLALLAHELRNPLSGISNAVAIMKLRSQGEVQMQRPVEIAERSLSQMTHLIDELTDTSRIGRGNVQLRYTTVDLRRLVDDLSLPFRSMSEARGVGMTVALPEEPVRVFGDPLRLSQVITNLMANAVKFTDQGEVRVALRQEDHTAVLTVADTGVGLSETVMQRMWEPFRQGDNHDRRGGLGLGLSVVRGLVELHGGSVSAMSAGIGKGACFTVELPLEEGLVGRKGGSAGTAKGSRFVPSQAQISPLTHGTHKIIESSWKSGLTP